MNPSHSLKNYIKIGGYSTWKKIIAQTINPEEIKKEIIQSLLRGRGGSGFHTGKKWNFINDTSPKPRYIVCNADEGEPGSCHDKDVMLYNPHQLIEGIMIAGYALEATVGYNYIRGEYQGCFHRMEVAIQEARAAGLLGANVNFELFNHLGAGSYICGEESALLESLEGKKGMPRLRPPFPTQSGLYGKPTIVNNVETLASVPVIMEKRGWKK